MNKQTKMLIGVGAVAVAGYFIWKSTQKKPFANLTANALVNGGKRKKKRKKVVNENPYGTLPSPTQFEYGEPQPQTPPSQTYLARRRNK